MNHARVFRLCRYIVATHADREIEFHAVKIAARALSRRCSFSLSNAARFGNCTLV